jgi:hypothetical protein
MKKIIARIIIATFVLMSHICFVSSIKEHH